MRPELICRQACVRGVIRGELWFLLRLVGCMGCSTFQAMVTPVFNVAQPILTRP